VRLQHSWCGDGWGYSPPGTIQLLLLLQLLLWGSCITASTGSGDTSLLLLLLLLLLLHTCQHLLQLPQIKHICCILQEGLQESLLQAHNSELRSKHSSSKLLCYCSCSTLLLPYRPQVALQIRTLPLLLHVLLLLLPLLLTMIALPLLLMLARCHPGLLSMRLLCLCCPPTYCTQRCSSAALAVLLLLLLLLALQLARQQHTAGLKELIPWIICILVFIFLIPFMLLLFLLLPRPLVPC
jgi:hypothetical protein